jgi:hypothetical protein
LSTAVDELSAVLRTAGDIDLPSLSDDELAALSPLTPPYAHVVPLTTLLEIDPDDWLDHARAGEASLLERGLLLEADKGVRASEELRAILLARQQPRAVTILEVTARNRTVWDGAYYAFDTGDFRIEEKTDGAFHRFRLRDVHVAALDLVDVVDPDGRATLAAADAEASEAAVQRPERRVRMLSMRRTGPETIDRHEAQLVVSGRGVWLVAGLVDAGTGASRVLARPLDASTLRDALEQYVLASF